MRVKILRTKDYEKTLKAGREKHELHAGEEYKSPLTSHVCACSVASGISDSATPWTVAHQAPLSMGFSRQEHWSGSPCPPWGDLPNPETEPTSPSLAGRFFYPLCHLGSPPDFVSGGEKEARR